MPTRPPTLGQQLRERQRAAAIPMLGGAEGRGTSTERGYGSRWRRARAIYLANHPVCVKCTAAGRAPRSKQVELDHITPHKGDERLFWDQDNWQTLCKVCHSEKTATEDGGFGRPASGAAVIGN